MQKLVFINGAGKEIDLSSGNFAVVNWEGLSNTDLNIQSQQVPFEDGGVFLDALMEQREIELTVAIYDGNDLELRYQKKRELISALNPKLGEGILTYTNDYLSKQIKAVPQIPLFENKNSNDAGTLKASVAFTCCNPYWEDSEETIVEINNGETVDIENAGDVVSMPKIEIDGSLTNPVVVNQTTNKAIKLEMETEKTTIIQTEVGQKGIYTTKADYKIVEGLLYNDSIKVGDNTILVGSDICIINEFGVATHYNSPVTQNILCIKYENGVYIAGTQGEGLLRSLDAIKWDVLRTPSRYGTIDALTFVNDVWFACGKTSDVPASILKSTDNGISWQGIGQYDFYGNAGFVIFYNNTYYIKNGTYFRCTTDFENWTSIQPANIPEDVIEIETNHWIGVTTNGSIVESANPETWTVIATPTQNRLNKIKKINDKYFGLGYMTIVESETAYSWYDITPENTLTDFNFLTITFILNQYYFYASQGLFVTRDLSVWDIQKYKTDDYLDIVFAFGYYYLFHNVNSNECEVLRSEDGTNFVTVDFPYTNMRILGTMIAENTLIIYSYNKIIVTNDGVNFTEKNTGLNTIQKVQFANGLYFVNTYTTQYTTFKGEDLEALVDMEVLIDNIVFYNGVYYRTSVTSSGFTVYSSTDLENWETLKVYTSVTCVGITIFKGALILITNRNIGDSIATTFYNFNNLSDFTQFKQYYVVNGGITKFQNKNNILWVCGNNGLVGQTTNGNVWSIQYTCGNYNSLCIEEKKIFVGVVGSDIALIVEVISAGEIDYKNNLISKMSINSNLDWGLLQGQNTINFVCDSGTGKIIITYRQKYIGV